jgi:hypothetical protein
MGWQPTALNALRRTAEGKRGRQGGPGVGAAWRSGTEKKRGPRCGGGWLGWPASGPEQRARAVEFPRDSGGRRGPSDAGASADKWGRATVGARWAAAGCGRVRQHGMALTRGPSSTVPPVLVFKPNPIYFKQI